MVFITETRCHRFRFFFHIVLGRNFDFIFFNKLYYISTSTNYYISKIDPFPRSIRRERGGTNVVKTSSSVARSCSNPKNAISF